MKTTERQVYYKMIKKFSEEVIHSKITIKIPASADGFSITINDFYVEVSARIIMVGVEADRQIGTVEVQRFL